MKEPAIYMLSNKPNGVIYTSVTSDLIKRIYEHKHKFVDSFSAKYNCDKLVYYELFSTMYDAITREK